MTAQRFAFAIHAAAGILVAGFLLVLSLTGAALVFADDAERVLEPATRVVEPAPPRAPLESLAALADRCFPEARLESVSIPSEPDAAAILRLREANVRLTAYVNPYNARLLGVERAGTGWRRWLVSLHASLLLGREGKAAVFAVGCVLLVSLGTGIYVYRCAIRSLLTRGIRRTALTSDLHAFVGLTTLPFQLLVAATGLWMLRGDVARLFSGSAEVGPASQPHQRSREDLPLRPNLDACADLACATVPCFEPRRVDLPRGARAGVRVWGRVPGSPLLEQANHVDLDATGARVEAVVLAGARSLESKLDWLAGPLHFGNFGGTHVKLIYGLLGLTPAVLAATGILLAIRRRQRRRARRPEAAAAVVGRAPEPSAGRRRGGLPHATSETRKRLPEGPRGPLPDEVAAPILVAQSSDSRGGGRARRAATRGGTEGASGRTGVRETLRS